MHKKMKLELLKMILDKYPNVIDYFDDEIAYGYIAWLQAMSKKGAKVESLKAFLDRINGP